jgi:exo-1,4-beta-D-glucosaminidase
MSKKSMALIVFCLLAAATATQAVAAKAQPLFRETIEEGWFIQSSAKAKAQGEQISRPGYDLKGWYPGSVPTTVLAALVKNKVYKDIFFADNLKSVSGEPFKVSWWYRTEFDLPAQPDLNTTSLEFEGINYRANVWLNGHKIADAATLYGAFRRFNVNATAAAKPGAKNVLAVEVFPPQPGEPTFGFVDWNPAAPDKGMGLWRPVNIRFTGPVSIQDPFVQSKLDLESFKWAKLTVSAEVRNNTDKAVSGVLEARVPSGKIMVSKPVTLAPNEVKKVVFSPAESPELSITNPRVWWTHDLGKPEMYGIQLVCKVADKPSDSSIVGFGIREVSDYLDDRGVRGFKLNGRKVLIRGGGWTDDMLMDNPYDSVKAQVEYARHMNLNSLRVEGFWGTSDYLYELCDRTGLLMMAGWSCQWEWDHYLGKPTDEKYGGINTPELIKLVAQSWKDQVRWLRNHPSIFVWMEGSDLLPEPALEREYTKILAEDDPSRPSVKSAKGWTSTLSGPTGVKMNGPYDYVSPNYWYLDKKNGGAFGFNTETGPGPQVPPLESLKKMFPQKALWPINPLWQFHCCRNEFENLNRYNEAMAKRLGPATGLKDYLAKAQFLNYEGMRAMYEAFVANRPKATGIIQWMYNSAWPKLWWQLYDYFLLPNGAFFGARKANESVHVFYNYGTGEVMASSNAAKPTGKLKAAAKVLTLEGMEKASREYALDMKADEVKSLGSLPKVEGLGPTYFLDLRLYDAANNLIGTNFYALSTVPDVLDEAKGTWFVTPLKGFADLTGLQKLPPVQLKTVQRFIPHPNTSDFEMTLENPSASPAFMVELMVINKTTGEALTPIFWDDNYLTLLPGEKRTVRASLPVVIRFPQQITVKVSGWNVK